MCADMTHVLDIFHLLVFSYKHRFLKAALLSSSGKNVKHSLLHWLELIAVLLRWPGQGKIKNSEKNNLLEKSEGKRALGRPEHR
jgi:hypothetical protein